ncbi:MAG TPA: zinc ribbon domain-containing protein [Myxococcales bacterium]
MPIYEYECGKCGKFEVIQKMSEEPLKKCEKCGKPVHRLVSLSSFALVGGGWYKDLYSSTNNKSGTASTSTSTDSKPESKPEAKPAKSETKSESKSEKSPAAA